MRRSRNIQWTILAVALLITASCSNKKSKARLYNLTQYIDFYQETDDRGHLFPGANVPFGFVRLAPIQHTCGWDSCSGYHLNDSIITGFGHITGTPEVITFFPATDDRREYPFERKFEIAKPGYYSVWMPKADIAVELTATAHVGMHRYFFPRTDQARIIVDFKECIGCSKQTQGNIIQENDSVISGNTGNGDIYVTVIFSQPIKNFKTTGDACREIWFDLTTEDALYVKVGLSNVSIENAKQNIETELPEWDFEQTAANAGKAWNEQLNKTVFESESDKEKKAHYTALYYSLIKNSTYTGK